MSPCAASCWAAAKRSPLTSSCSLPAPNQSGCRCRGPIYLTCARCARSAARNMLGQRERYAAVPFFWSQHYDVSIDYVGHAAAWDEIVQNGNANAHDVALRFRQAGRTLAVATIFRGRESLLAEAAMERGQSP